MAYNFTGNFSGNFSDAFTGNFSNIFAQAFAGGIVGGIIAVLGILAIFLAIVLYVYFACAWMTIAKKKKHKYPWLAWIPFANLAMILQIGGFHWAWIFLLLIPVLGWLAIYIMMIIATWRIFDSLRYPGWFALAPLLDVLVSGTGTLAYLIVIGVVAWSKK